ncbi:GntR family transcriptional regulator [Microtetraspora sp. AC03309]|uniref:GntR family transcriptional regulator n=1 Tax=Microtetraspora sp. AC03309 TaxID=2779376 RepID=UPI001E5CD871|nr:GntR family transcriptional regulator [Microtetraspora sp. AC03309]MCC5575417.1 GntR family transcriptional regulator [Microtetraspora sp. AC03309]
MTQTRSKSQIAYDWIRERIETRQFSPGYRLVLDVLARQLGVSTVPVREAIRLLEAEGLVTFERNVGAQVAFIQEQEYLHTMQTLALVEGAATALSAPRITGDHVARARAINDQMAESLKDFDPQRFTELNLAFHTVLFEECPNPHIVDLVHRGWKRLAVLRDSVFGFVPGRAQESVDEHEALLRLLEAGQTPLTIELAARDHRLGTLNAVLAYQADRQRHATSNADR